MSFVQNSAQQLTLNDRYQMLTKREKTALEKSWSRPFSEQIFPRINEQPFSALYSEKASRSNAPVNVTIGSLILKELTSQTDDELIESLMFDIRYQYALHTTSYAEQPLSAKTLSRFRVRCYLHEQQTGEDLIHGCITELSEAMAVLLKISPHLKRMDSLMVSSNMKKLSRLELLYVCVSNLVEYLHNQKADDLLIGLEHYYDPSDHNRVIYHTKSESSDNRISLILRDAQRLLLECPQEYRGTQDYSLLSRAISEQTLEEADGVLRLKTKADGGMDSTILQNPSDPDASYREKAGKRHRGYAANVVESVGETGSIVTDYQYESNTYSDSEFFKDTVNRMGEQSEKVTIVTDGAFGSAENSILATSNNIELVTTCLTGRDTKDIFADFKFSEDGETVISCASGYVPKSVGKPNKYGQCRVSFPKSRCENCPHRDECNPKLSNKTAVIHISRNMSLRAQQQRKIKSDENKALYKVRNGVESIPSILRRRYSVDSMPVRGKIRSRLWFGFKIAALNFKKVCGYLDSVYKCAHNAVNA